MQGQVRDEEAAQRERGEEKKWWEALHHGGVGREQDQRQRDRRDRLLCQETRQRLRLVREAQLPVVAVESRLQPWRGDEIDGRASSNLDAGELAAACVCESQAECSRFRSVAMPDQEQGAGAEDEEPCHCSGHGFSRLPPGSGTRPSRSIAR